MHLSDEESVAQEDSVMIKPDNEEPCPVNDSDSLTNIGRNARMRDLINHSNETDEDNLDWVEATQDDETPA